MKKYEGWNVYDYFEWLLEKIDDPVAENHTELLKDLHNIPFRWKLHRDEFRAYDGINLRPMYMKEKGITDNGYIFTEYRDTECSMLEMMIALAEYFSYDVIGASYKTTAQWFWSMANNLGLLEATDYNYSPEYVRDKIRVFTDRAYAKNGEGGMFPLKHPSKDQRTVEIWYQLSEWFKENYWENERNEEFY